MKCKTVIRELSNYLDADLDAATRAEIERHLDACEDCRLVVDTTRKTVQVFCGAEPLPLSDDVRARLYAALARHLQRRPS